MSARVQIRPMEGSDLDEVIALAAQLAHAPQWPRAAYEAAMDGAATPTRICLVATSAELGVAGFVIGSAIGGQAEIESIAVAPGLHRRGIGRALLDALIGQVGMLGVTEVWLEVRESNGAAAGLYRSAGFVQSGRRRGYYTHPQEDALLFLLDLGRGAAL